MPLTLADILQEHFPSYAQQNRAQLTAAHYRAARRVLSCRTPAMGGRVYSCTGCTKKHYAYHSCNHRSCPRCGARDQALWSAKQESRLLPVPYYMVTFTVPAELRSCFLAFPREAYSALLRESARALQDIIATKYSGAEIGMTSVLHTWGRQVQHHPHVHIIVPAVCLDRLTGTAIHPKKADAFLVHYRPLAARFRTRLRRALQQVQGLELSLEARACLSNTKPWNVQLKPVGTGKTALRYLARYVQKSAFSQKRLLGYDARGNIRLQWTCSNTGKVSVLHLHPHEFIRRWLLHVLPKGLARIRHYGYLSSAAKKARHILRASLQKTGHLNRLSEPAPILPELPNHCCTHCGSQLKLLRRIIAPRPPPMWKL